MKNSTLETDRACVRLLSSFAITLCTCPIVLGATICTSTRRNIRIVKKIISVSSNRTWRSLLNTSKLLSELLSFLFLEETTSLILVVIFLLKRISNFCILKTWTNFFFTRLQNSSWHIWFLTVCLTKNIIVATDKRCMIIEAPWQCNITPSYHLLLKGRKNLITYDKNVRRQSITLHETASWWDISNLQSFNHNQAVHCFYIHEWAW